MGKRGGTKGKGQREAVEEERAAGAEKMHFKSKIHLKSILKRVFFRLRRATSVSKLWFRLAGSHFGGFLATN